MGSINVIQPIDTATLSDQKEFRLRALAAGLARAAYKKLGSIGDDLADREIAYKYIQAGKWPKSLDCREAQPILDFGCALDQWNTAALAVVGTAYSALQAIAAPALAANKIAVFWKIGLETVPVPVSRITFRSGGAAGNVVGVYDLEQLINHQQLIGYFSEPVVIDPTTTFAVQVLCRIATGVLADVQLGCFIFEPAGTTVAS